MHQSIVAVLMLMPMPGGQPGGDGHCWNRPFYSCVLSYLAMNASEAGVELALIQTSLLFSCKCQLVSIRTT